MKNCFNCKNYDESNYIFTRCKCRKITDDKYVENIRFTFAAEDIEIDIDCNSYKEMEG